MLDPAFRALAQLDDPAFLRPVLHGVLWSALAFLLLSLFSFTLNLDLRWAGVPRDGTWLPQPYVEGAQTSR